MKSKCAAGAYTAMVTARSPAAGNIVASNPGVERSVVEGLRPAELLDRDPLDRERVEGRVDDALGRPEQQSRAGEPERRSRRSQRGDRDAEQSERHDGHRPMPARVAETAAEDAARDRGGGVGEE